MTKTKREEVEIFYLSERDNLISHIECKLHDVVLSEEVLHRSILKCIMDFSKYCGNDKLTFDYVMNICNEIIAEIEIEKYLTTNEYVVLADPLDVFLENESLEFLVGLINNMHTYSNVLKLYLFENFTIGEMASILNMKPNTVSKQIQRGLLKLKYEIEKSKYFQL